MPPKCPHKSPLLTPSPTTSLLTHSSQHCWPCVVIKMHQVSCCRAFTLLWLEWFIPDISLANFFPSFKHANLIFARRELLSTLFNSTIFPFHPPAIPYHTLLLSSIELVIFWYTIWQNLLGLLLYLSSSTRIITYERQGSFFIHWCIPSTWSNIYHS